MLFLSMQLLAWLPQGRTQGETKTGFFEFWVALCQKLLQIDGYMQRGILKESKALSIDAIFNVIAPGAYPEEK